jgi:hypothetical protein
MRKGRWIMGIGAAILGAFGCRTAMISYKPIVSTSNAIQPNGIRYNVGKDILIVEVDITEYAEKIVAINDDNELGLLPRVGISAQKTNVTLRTVPDAREVYILDVIPRGFKNQTLTVQVGENGLLSSVNCLSEDRTAEAITNIAKASATVVGSLIGFRGGSLETVLRSASFFTLTKGVSERAKRRLGTLPLETLYFIDKSDEAKSLWTEMGRIEDDIAKHQENIRNKIVSAANEPSVGGLGIADKQIGFLKQGLNDLLSRWTSLKDSFQSSLDRFVSQEGIGRKTQSRNVVRVLELTDVPKLFNEADLRSEATIRNKLNEGKFEKALELFENAGILVFFDLGVEITQPDSPIQNRGPLAKEKELKIRYRQAWPGILRVYAQTQVVGKKERQFVLSMTKIDEKAILVLHPNAPIRSVGFSPAAFSSQNLQLTVNPQGRVTGITKSATSPLASASAGIAQSLAAFRDETATTIKRINEIEKDRREIALGALQAQVDELEKRKKIIDSQIALEGVLANRELILDKTTIDQQLDSLNSRLALAKQQDTYDLSLEQAKTTAEVELLKQQVELLKQQLEQMKQEAELAKGKK